MIIGTRVKCKKDGEQGIVTYSYGTANEVRLDSGNYRYVMDANLSPLMFESRAGESVAELESLPQEKPLSDLEKASLLSCGDPNTPFDMKGRTWKDYYPDWEGTDVNDGPEVDILLAYKRGYADEHEAIRMLTAILDMRRYHGKA